MEPRPGEAPWYSEDLDVDQKITVGAQKGAGGASCLQYIGKNDEPNRDEEHVEISIAGKGYFGVHVFCSPKEP